jgi:hypothetical protein
LRLQTFMLWVFGIFKTNCLVNLITILYLLWLVFITLTAHYRVGDVKTYLFLNLTNTTLNQCFSTKTTLWAGNKIHFFPRSIIFFNTMESLNVITDNVVNWLIWSIRKIVVSLRCFEMWPRPTQKSATTRYHVATCWLRNAALNYSLKDFSTVSLFRSLVIVENQGLGILIFTR